MIVLEKYLMLPNLLVRMRRKDMQYFLLLTALHQHRSKGLLLPSNCFEIPPHWNELKLYNTCDNGIVFKRHKKVWLHYQGDKVVKHVLSMQSVRHIYK